jgi:hypothetical protein
MRPHVSEKGFCQDSPFALHSGPWKEVNQVPQFLEDDGLNESQPAAAIPDFDLDDSADLPTPEEAAEDGKALLAVLDDPKLAGLSEDVE